ECQMPILADADKSNVDRSGSQQVPNFAAYFFRTGFTVKQVVVVDAGLPYQSLDQILAKTGRMLDGQADVLVQVKHFDLLPIHTASVGQRIQELELRCPGCRNDARCAPLSDGAVDGRSRLRRGSISQRNLI